MTSIWLPVLFLVFFLILFLVLPLPLLSIMAGLRNHRVVIASLFLPTTAVLGESVPATPEIPPDGVDFLPKFSNSEKPSRVLPVHNHHSSISGITPTIRSIVEDLQDKVRIPAVQEGLVQHSNDGC